MHKTTQEELEKAQRWFADIARADSIALALDPLLPEATDDCPTWGSIGNSFGNLTVFVYDALAVADASPILRRLRELGFRREGTPTQNEREGSLEWTYARGKWGDGDRVSVSVKLTLRKADADTGPAPTCRYVQVGTKEVPDMKLLCGDELEAWKASQQVEA